MREAWDLPGPRAPPKPSWVGPLGWSQARAAAWKRSCLGKGIVGEVMEADELVFGTAGGACLVIEAGQAVRIGVIHRGKLPQGVFVFLHLALR